MIVVLENCKKNPPLKHLKQIFLCNIVPKILWENAFLFLPWPRSVKIIFAADSSILEASFTVENNKAAEFWRTLKIKLN